MKKYTLKKAMQLIKDGLLESIQDVKIGYIEIRRYNGKKETVEIIN